MNIKKLTSLIFNRTVLIAALIVFQAALLLVSMVFFSAFFVYFYWNCVILSILAVLIIVSRQTDPGYKIAWIIPILIFPVFGWLVYLLCGGNRLSARMRRKMQGMDRKMIEVLEQDCKAESLSGFGMDAVIQSRYLERYAHCPAYTNTDTRYFPLGDDAFPVMLEELRHAKRYIFLEYFIIAPGIFWDSVLEILKEKHAAGVDVRIIYDDVGCLPTLPMRYDRKLEAETGIPCCSFNRFKPVLSIRMNNRDHRKFCIIDGHTAFTGGINLADEYINEEERFGYWKDAALRTEGAAVWNFTVMFLDHWNAFRPSEEDYAPFMPQAESLSAQSDGVIQPYGDSPLDEEPVAETVYLDILAQSQQYVYFYTPYLAIGEEMLDALRNAAKRGVDVRLVLPGIPDKKLVFRLSRSYYLPLLRAGVRIYEYTPGFLHAKCCVSDDRAAVVGSINMDYRSMFLHFECGVLLLQNSQVLALRDDVRRTLPQCREVQCADCRTGLAGTVLDSVLRLLSPLM